MAQTYTVRILRKGRDGFEEYTGLSEREAAKMELKFELDKNIQTLSVTPEGNDR